MRLISLGACLLMLGCGALAEGEATARESTALAAPTERLLPPLPNARGFAGPQAGVSNGALIVAGGTNFPEKMPWEGGKKVWHDDVYVLESPAATQWKHAGKLPRPLAHAAAVTTRHGLLCVGGSDGTRAVDDVVLIEWKDGRLATRKLAELPAPLAGAAGAVIGDTVYIAGGYDGTDPASGPSSHSFLSLDLSRHDAKWTELQPWPGAARFYAVAAAAEDSIYVISGMSRELDDAGKPKLRCLTDGYRYTPGKEGAADTWRRIADLPRAHAAAPGPAAYVNRRWLALIGGGVDDEDLARPMDVRSEFRKTVTAYDTQQDKWEQIGTVSQSRVATPLVKWGDDFVMPSGEVKSGVRSPQVWAYRW
jgi:N-acetylneuraminic acid mutarotase